MAIVLFASIFPVELFHGASPELRGADGQFSAKQGDAFLVRVPVDGAPESVTGRLLKRRIPFFSGTGSDGRPLYEALVGIDILDQPGTHELVVDLVYPGRAQRLSYNVLVIKEQFPAQRLTLPKDKVELDPATLTRVKTEQQAVRQVLNILSPHRFWKATFLEPVEGTISGSFGSRRIINGHARSPHSGEDISAPQGADVRAMNDGIARLTVDHFFSGKGVFLDHGLGLHSMYFHLSEVLVKDGERVSRGQVIGRVGASGRATGPHLHWGVHLNGARINPYALLNLPLDAAQVSTR